MTDNHDARHEPETTNVAPVGDDPTIVAGRYRIVRTLGRGGGGIVWLAHDEKLGREVALKRVAGEADAEVLVTRGLREARTSATLAHEHVVRVYDAFEHEGSPWIVMEYVPGPSLADLIEGDRSLPAAKVALIGSQVATALAAAHRAGIIHRDVKPANVLLSDDSGRNAKLTDFGIARAEEDTALTKTGFVAGTAAYFSPELARGEDPSPASDVWALGATLYAAVEGRRPFRAEPNAVAQLHTIAREAPAAPIRAGVLAPVLRGMLERDPARRWDAEHAAAELRRIVSHGTTSGASHDPAGIGHWPAGAGAAAAAAYAHGAAEPPSTQAVPITDPTRAIPVAGERSPESWPGQGSRQPGGHSVAHQAGSAHEPRHDSYQPARTRPGPGRPPARRRPVRRSMWLGWLLAIPLLAALGWLVWSILQGVDRQGEGTDPTSVTQPAEAGPVTVQEALDLANDFYVVLSFEGPEGVAPMLGPDAEVDPEIRDGLTNLRYEGMTGTQREDGSVLVESTVDYFYGTTRYRQTEELVIGRTEAGGDPLVLLRTTGEPEITDTGTGDDDSGDDDSGDSGTESQDAGAQPADLAPGNSDQAPGKSRGKGQDKGKSDDTEDE